MRGHREDDDAKTCPFCQQAIGTLEHVAWRCRAMPDAADRPIRVPTDHLQNRLAWSMGHSLDYDNSVLTWHKRVRQLLLDRRYLLVSAPDGSPLFGSVPLASVLPLPYRFRSLLFCRFPIGLSGFARVACLVWPLSLRTTSTASSPSGTSSSTRVPLSLCSTSPAGCGLAPPRGANGLSFELSAEACPADQEVMKIPTKSKLMRGPLGRIKKSEKTLIGKKPTKAEKA